MIDEVTRDALTAMLNGGQQIAEDAHSKWWGGKYATASQEQTQERMKHWKAVKARVRELVNVARDSV